MLEREFAGEITKIRESINNHLCTLTFTKKEGKLMSTLKKMLSLTLLAVSMLYKLTMLSLAVTREGLTVTVQMFRQAGTIQHHR